MEREVRYCTTEDGVRIAYQVEGEGPAVVWINSFVASFSLDQTVPEIQSMMGRLAARRQLIRYDVRGTGLSQREVGDLSHRGLVLDLEAVVRAAGLQRVSLFALTLGGPRAIEYAAMHPEQVEGLVLDGTFGRGRDTMAPERARAFIELARADWELAAQAMTDRAGRRERELADLLVRMGEINRESTTGDVAARILEACYAADVTALLERVRAPTLVVHALNDPTLPFACGQALAAGIPNARLLPLESSVHGPSPALRQAVADAIDAFLPAKEEESPEPEAATPPPAAFRTVLFTDIVGHTEMMQRLGDKRGREVLREHERITREVLKAHGGTEVKTMGDGFMASFSSVTRAVECAIALQRAFAERNASLPARPEALEARAEEEPIVVRVGLNAGEPIEEEGPDGRSDLFGATVILAARIAGQAEGAEVMASLAVRELCAGKGFLFADRGEQLLRGFEDPVRLFEIRWRE